MPITVVIPKETKEGERRVAIIPPVAKKLAAMRLTVLVEKGAGLASRIPDAAYEGVTQVDSKSLYKEANLILKVQPPSVDEAKKFKEGSIFLGFIQPHAQTELIKIFQERKITAFAMELVPRISRAQSMDALSSQAAVAGYKAALLAANALGRFLPMLTTAAGTIRPATVLVIGAGVAGLQAIATARRLGAQVEAYDVRAAAKEQVQSLGAKFVDVGVKAEGTGGYARELTSEEKSQQQEVLARHVAKADAIIATAAIPGRTAPKIITKAMVEGMKSGAVIIDLAAESGGNCELTEPGKVVEHGQVAIHGPLNVPSTLAEHASEMYSKNLLSFLELLIKDGEFNLNWNDQVLADSVVTHDGEIKHAPTKERLAGGKS